MIDAVGAEQMPFVIFVTAFDRYALRAFDVHALDYLLKPFDRDRFRDALARAREQIERHSNGDLERRLLALVNDLKPAPQPLERFVIKSERTRVLRARRRTSSGSRRRATTSSCTSAPRRTCSAKR